MVTVAARPSTDKTRDDRRSPRDWRRHWAAVLPRAGRFRNPSAQLLAEWADAIQSEEGWEAWAAEHPDGADPLPEPPR